MNSPIKPQWDIQITTKMTIPIILLYFFAFPAFAQNLYLENIVISKKIKKHSPVGVSFKFPSDVKRLYCSTRTNGATSKTTITHVWYRNDKEMAKVDLPIGFPSWRTYSSIKIRSGWKGHWWVEIIHGETILGGIEFTIE